MGGEPCSRSSAADRRLERGLETWVSVHVGRLHDEFFAALGDGDGERARRIVDQFESALAVRLEGIRTEVMSETAELLDRQAEELWRAQPSLDEWLRVRRECLRLDHLEALRDDDEDLARRHVERFEADLRRRLAAVEHEIVSEATVMLDDEVKARREENGQADAGP